MKITLVISSLTCGGAERVLVLMAQGFLERYHEINVITLSDKSTDFYQLPQGCNRIALGVMQHSNNAWEAISNNFRRVSLLRRAVQSTNPDVVISFLRITNVTTLLALLGSKYPVIVTEHNDPQVFSYGSLWETLRRLTYPYCAALVSVSKGVDQGFNSIPAQQRSVIYNPIMVMEQAAEDILPQELDANKQWLVSMGRLTEQKGFDLLLQAFAKLAPQYPDWQLVILGKGELREELEKLRDDLGLSKQVIFTGALSNPFAVIKPSQIFVMASRNEGFPMAHGEALACGLPVIATDCPSGPREMIRDGVDGVLVPNYDIAALASAMASLMSDKTRRQQLAAKAPEVEERFGLKAIITQWETLINQLLEETN